MNHTIRNFDELTCSELTEVTENELRHDALAIAEAGYGAINVGNALRRKLKIEGDELIVSPDPARCHLTETVRKHLAGRKIFFVGIGKCAFATAVAIEEILGEHLTNGIAFDVSSQPEQKLNKIETIAGTHPLPSEANVLATKHIIEFLSKRTEEDLVIMLISGGGSALLCLPEAPMTYADEVELFQELTANGAPIQDMNIVRKHISLARGGGLARAAYPADVVSFIASDVPGNDLTFISSGPTVRDCSTVADAEKILVKYNVALPEGASLFETPKEEKYFERVTNILFLSNQNALSAMQNEATRLGYVAEIVCDRFSGEARDIGRDIVSKLHETAEKTVLLYAGESTVTLREVRPPSQGGRNQEMALVVLADIREGELVIPFASDGHDNTDHAGAIADALTIAHAQEKNLSADDALAAHSSYEFFSTTGDALVTGYTGSNVSDLVVALKK